MFTAIVDVESPYESLHVKTDDTAVIGSCIIAFIVLYTADTIQYICQRQDMMKMKKRRQIKPNASNRE
jgi:hypothetical protein